MILASKTTSNPLVPMELKRKSQFMRYSILGVEVTGSVSQWATMACAARALTVHPLSIAKVEHARTSI